MAYDIGDADTRTVTWKNTAGTPTDPTTVTATLYAPDGTSTTPTPTNPSVGVYSVDVANDQAGHWRLHWVATGALAAAEWDEWDVQAAPGTRSTEIVTLDEAKAALNLTGTAQDPKVASYVSAISAVIDDLCGYVVQRTVTNEEHRGGGRLLFLRHTPVVSVTTVTEYNGTTAQVLAAENFPSATTANDYYFDTSLNVLERRASGYPATFASGRVLVTYVAGRYADTPSVEQRFKRAALTMLTQAWRPEQGVGSQTYGADDYESPLPPMLVTKQVRQWLGGELVDPAIG